MNTLDLLTQTINHSTVHNNAAHCHKPLFARPMKTQQILGGEQSQVKTHNRYNIEQFDDNKYRITLAVAGFKLSDLQITSQHNALVVQGKKAEQKQASRLKTLHQGFAVDNFEQKFKLENHLKVKGAALNDGLLVIDLFKEIPEALKSKEIKINH
jgi:molecular chaperone IbpA